MPTSNDAASAGDGVCRSAKSTDNPSTLLFESLSAFDWELYSAARVQAGNTTREAQQQEGFIVIDELPAAFDRVFGRIDTNNDKMLSLQELAIAVGDASFTSKDAQALAALYKTKWNLAKLHDDKDGDRSGVSVGDIEALKTAITDVTVATDIDDRRTPTRLEMVISVAKDAIQRTSDSQQPEISKELFANSVDPLESIRASAIAQGMIGNCYFESPMASLAEADPALIARMITDYGNGLYSVKFPDFDVPVFVTEPTEAEMGLFNKGSKHGIWACVMEKAFGEYKYMTGATRSGAIAESADGGGQPSDVFKLMTGKPGQDIFSSDAKFVREVLLKAKQDGKAVCASTPGNGMERTIDGFAPNHAYSILDFDVAGPDGGTITIRNPWAGAEGTPEGLTKISVQQFTCQFKKLIVQG